MKSILIIVVLFISGKLFAFTPIECKARVEKSRITLLVFMTGNHSDQYKKLIKNSVLEADECINSLTVEKEKMSILEELKSTWQQFKNTRESELIPALLSEKEEDKGKKIAMGKQKERIKKISYLFAELSK